MIVRFSIMMYMPPRFCMLTNTLRNISEEHPKLFPAIPFPMRPQELPRFKKEIGIELK